MKRISYTPGRRHRCMLAECMREAQPSSLRRFGDLLAESARLLGMGWLIALTLLVLLIIATI